VFSADSFRFAPSFLRRMAVTSFDIDDAVELGRSVPSVDVAVDQQVLAMQRQVLGTLMGDNVNLGSRLESVNKQYKTNIIIGENTYELVKDNVIVRELDLIRVKGKKVPVRIYELIAMKN